MPLHAGKKCSALSSLTSLWRVSHDTYIRKTSHRRHDLQTDIRSTAEYLMFFPQRLDGHQHDVERLPLQEERLLEKMTKRFNGHAHDIDSTNDIPSFVGSKKMPCVTGVTFLRDKNSLLQIDTCMPSCQATRCRKIQEETQDLYDYWTVPKFCTVLEGLF